MFTQINLLGGQCRPRFDYSRAMRDVLTRCDNQCSGDPRFIWGQLRVTTEAVPHNDPDAPRPRLVRYEQARVLGGGSSISGQLANQGAPYDYDEWEQRGASGWRWGTVLPYFVGPVGHLRDLGIAVWAARAGVGQRLMDHPSISISSYLKPDAARSGRRWRHISNARQLAFGTARVPAGWGADDDPMAVIDHQGRVRGAHGLRVVDASIFPVVPCANTNFPTMMAAEKIADEILRAEASARPAYQVAAA